MANMPIYEYRCNDCGKINEFFLKTTKDEKETKCKHCGSEDLHKIFSKSNISTKGHLIGSQGGKTCCGRDERCDTPPCSDDGICKR